MTFFWGDGTSDKITLGINGGTVLISSTPNNTGKVRNKVLKFRASGCADVSLHISQEAGQQVRILRNFAGKAILNNGENIKLN